MVGGTKLLPHDSQSEPGCYERTTKARQEPRQNLLRREKQKPSKLYVSLDNADTVIEGGPQLPSVGNCGVSGTTLSLWHVDSNRFHHSRTAHFIAHRWRDTDMRANYFPLYYIVVRLAWLAIGLWFLLPAWARQAAGIESWLTLLIFWTWRVVLLVVVVVWLCRLWVSDGGAFGGW